MGKIVDVAVHRRIGMIVYTYCATAFYYFDNAWSSVLSATINQTRNLSRSDMTAGEIAINQWAGSGAGRAVASQNMSAGEEVFSNKLLRKQQTKISSPYMPGYALSKLEKTGSGSDTRYALQPRERLRMPRACKYQLQERDQIDRLEYRVETGAVDQRLSDIKKQRVLLDIQTPPSSGRQLISTEIRQQPRLLPYHGTDIVFDAPKKGLGTARAQGRRAAMEDAHVARQIKIKIGNKMHLVSLQAMFDGHGGWEMASHARDNVLDFVRKRLEEFNPRELTDTGIFNALKLAMVDLSRSFECDITRSHAGSTANVALLIGHSLFVANVGDSRAMLVTKDLMIPLSEDAKPDLPKYKKSIEKRQGCVVNGRVDGRINIARVLGDHALCGMTARPKITKQKLQPGQQDWLLVQCCDGILETLPADKIASDIRAQRDAGLPLSRIAAQTVKMAHQTGSGDNLSVMISSLSSGWLEGHMPSG